MNLGPMEIIVILAIALLIFGPKNLPKLGSAMGKTVKNIREGMEGDEDDKAPATAVDADVTDADTDADADASTGVYCSKCGTKNATDAAFCSKCGNKLASANE